MRACAVPAGTRFSIWFHLWWLTQGLRPGLKLKYAAARGWILEGFGPPVLPEVLKHTLKAVPFRNANANPTHLKTRNAI